MASGNRRQEMECAICLERLRQPRTLTCMHNFCADCLEGLAQDQRILCPTCRKETPLGQRTVGDLPKNIALINIMESFCEQCLNRNRQVCCSHCGLWLCSQCRGRCKREQVIMDQSKVLVRDLNRQELLIHEKRLRLTENAQSIMDKINAAEGNMIKNVRLNAKDLKDQVEKNMAEQLDVLDKLTTGNINLRKEVSGLIVKIEDCLKKERSEVEIETFAAQHSQWKSSIAHCATQVSQVNSSIVFVPGDSAPAVGKLEFSFSDLKKSEITDDQRGKKKCSTDHAKDLAPLTSSMLAEANLLDQKQMLGERLFPLIQSMHQELAGKITGMILELDNDELLHMLKNHKSLEAKVEEAVDVLQAHQAKEEAARKS